MWRTTSNDLVTDVESKIVGNDGNGMAWMALPGWQCRNASLRSGENDVGHGVDDDKDEDEIDVGEKGDVVNDDEDEDIDNDDSEEYNFETGGKTCKRDFTE